MMEDTIRKDVLDVDQRILELAAKLSNERANLIRQEVGLHFPRSLVIVWMLHFFGMYENLNL